VEINKRSNLISYFFKSVVSYTPSTLNQASATSQKRTDSKKGLFLGVLAGKRGFRAEKKHFILHFFMFLWFVAFVSSWVSVSFGKFTPLKKIVPKNLP